MIFNKRHVIYTGMDRKKCLILGGGGGGGGTYKKITGMQDSNCQDRQQ